MFGSRRKKYRITLQRTMGTLLPRNWTCKLLQRRNSSRKYQRIFWKWRKLKKQNCPNSTQNEQRLLEVLFNYRGKFWFSKMFRNCNGRRQIDNAPLWKKFNWRSSSFPNKIIIGEFMKSFAQIVLRFSNQVCVANLSYLLWFFIALQNHN